MSLVSACQTATKLNHQLARTTQTCDQRHLLSVDYDGQVLDGSKAQLIASILNGQSISVGWALDWDQDGTEDITHWHHATFLSIFEDEVFTQTPSIEVQRPLVNEKRIRFDTVERKWVGLLGTTGQLENRFGTDAEPNTMRARSWWCLQYGEGPRSS